MSHLTVIGAHTTPKPVGVPCEIAIFDAKHAVVITSINGRVLGGEESREELNGLLAMRGSGSPQEPPPLLNGQRWYSTPGAYHVVADTETFTPTAVDGDTFEFLIDGEVFWRGTAAELKAKGGKITPDDIDQWRQENISYCTDCGWHGEGLHACEGVPGGFGDDDESEAT